MKLTIFAATGGIGRRILDQAVAAGHEVTAVVRDPAKVPHNVRTFTADLALMEELLRDSGLDWTVVRPPRLTDKPLTGTYRTAYGRNIRGGALVSRADVAHYMLHALDDPTSIGQTVGIAR